LRATGLRSLSIPPAHCVRRVSGSRIADWLPPFVNAIRTFAIVGVVSLFWIEIAWPSGMTAVSFAAIVANLFPLRGDQAYSASRDFSLGACLSAVVAATLEFSTANWLLAFLLASRFSTLAIFN